MKRNKHKKSLENEPQKTQETPAGVWSNIFLKTWRPYIWFFLVISIIYFKSLFYNYTYLDDNVLIMDNFHFIRDLGNIGQAFFQDVFLSYSDAYYRPMLSISLMLDAQLGGTSLFTYHVTNILIHILTVCFLFVFLLKLNYQRGTAFIISLIFAVHPILSQAVAWIPGRNDSLMALFVLPAFIWFHNAVETKKWPAYILHFLFFTLALFTKESALLMAIVFLTYLYIIKKEKIFSISSYIFYSGWAAIAVFWFLMRQAAFSSPIGLTLSIIIKSWINNSSVAIQLLGKMLFPFNQSVLPIIQDTTYLYGVIALLFLSASLMFTSKKRFNYIIFGFSWLFFFIAPTFIWPQPDAVTFFLEHRIYIPIIGLFIILLEIEPVKGLLNNRKLAVILSIITIAVFSGLTIYHNDNFKDQVHFWKNAVDTSPHSPLAHRNLGAMYYLEGKYDNAEQEFKRSIHLNPYESMAHNNLGLIYANQGKYREAEEEYKKELTYNPNYDNAFFNMGLLYYKTGRIQEAAILWRKAIEINPNYVDAYQNLAVYYVNMNNLNEARYYIGQVINRGGKVQPDILKKLQLSTQ
ncbi:MAG: tetratricopeptide repeat protein [Candidatus Margulisiibacteriota bacterium]